MQNHCESIVSTAMENFADAASYVTRQDILNFPFPYKMWLVVHLDFCDFLRWNRDGTVILLDLVALEEYLNSTRSIFKIKNRSVFLDHLDQFKFDRLNATPEAEEDLLLQYRNENFQRHRLDLLAKIRRHTYQLLGEIESAASGKGAKVDSRKNRNLLPSNDDVTTLEQHQMQCRRVAERMLGDLCFMSHGGLSNIQKSRLRFQIVLNFQNETRILQEKLQASDEHAASQVQAQQRRFATAPVEEEQVIELPVELFENPHDSVLHLGEDFRPEYAGYYGNCSKEQILHFFGDYLPMYEDGGSMEVKKIVAEVCANNHNSLNSDLEQMHERSILSHEEELKITSTPMSQKSMPSLNLSSSLEPIFKTDEEDDRANQHYNFSNGGANPEAEAEISMEEFIKFNHSDAGTEIKAEAISVATAAASKDFSQMPSTVKMEITTDEDDSENEANFRNFFSQYRASLNLLYDRH